MRFDLTAEPWIPVRDSDGHERELGLRDLFRAAPDLSDLAIAFAPERIAVTRILVAVLQAATRGPSGRQERIGWLNDPTVVVGEVDAYLDEWRGGFDLFDPYRPFMQRPLGDDVKDTPIAALRLDWASGNNATLFDHHHDADRSSLMPTEAARALLTTLLYQPGGGVAKPFNRTDSPGSKPLLVLPLGRTLWETLVLSCADYDDPGGDAPIWERYDHDHAPDKDGTTPLGWLDRLTWRSRAIRLLPGANGRVGACRLQQHLKLADGSLGDAHAAVTRIEGEEPRIVRLAAGKRLWRQAEAVLRGVSGPQPRSVVDQAARALYEHRREHPQILVTGLQVDQAKIGDAQSAILPVSVALLEGPQRIQRVGEAIELAERASRALGAACGAFHTALAIEPAPAARADWQQPFWARVAREFPPLLRALADAEGDLAAGDPAWTAWTGAVGRYAQSALDLQLTPRPVGSGHRAQVRAVNVFRWRCRQDGIPLPRRGSAAVGDREQAPAITTTGAL